jgi:hypothetical protein
MRVVASNGTLDGLTRSMAWRIALLAVAACAALLPLPAGLVDRFYANGAYRVLQPILTTVSNLTPVPLFDLIIVMAVAGWGGLALRDLRRSNRQWARAATRIVVRTATWSAALYIVFLLTWGLNYRRLPLQDRLSYDAERVTADAARRLGVGAAEQLNRLYAPAHAELGPPSVFVVDPSLAAAFARAARETAAHAVVVARPKRTGLAWYFRLAAVDGMTDPFFLETLVRGDLLPLERPFVVAHEWSHLAGAAHEGEANFLGWLACMHGSAGHQYSGWLFLHQQVAGVMSPSDRGELAGRLDPGPLADLRAIAERIQRTVSPRLEAASRQTYDAYLKANRVDEGIASYAEVVRLILGVRFDEDWTPRRAPAR